MLKDIRLSVLTLFSGGHSIWDLSEGLWNCAYYDIQLNLSDKS